ncbi:hypothetical protein ACHAPJ_011694 [Fusarium lateritium]
MLISSYFASGLYAASLVLCNPLIIPGQHVEKTARDNALNYRAAPDLSAAPARKPFYAIAHRCNDMGAVQRAVNDGANAIEMDLFAESDGWWASHDGPSKNGNKATEIFNAIAGHRKAGKPITFVWLDIKNPDACALSDQAKQHCSIMKLRDLARQLLEPSGVRVLFGFYQNENGPAGKLIRTGLNSMEAMNIDGRSAPLRDWFNANGPADVKKRVLSYGDVDLSNGFGTCTEPGDAHLTCTQLRQATESRAFGKVFGWTAAVNQVQLVESLLNVNIDGVIYGLGGAVYGGSAGQALSQIRSSLAKHSEYYYAGKNDYPW